MINPLRCPIVLIALLVIMLGYVHVSHRHRQRAEEMVTGSDEEIELRTPSSQVSNFILRPRTTEPDAARPESEIPLPLPSTRPPTSTDPASLRSSPRSESQAFMSRSDDLQPTMTGHHERELTRNTAQSMVDPIRSVTPRDGTPAIVRGPKTPNVYTRRFDATTETQQTMHRVVDGDTLRSLAEKYFGDPSRAHEIFAANRHLLVQPDLLPLGEMLRIPAKEQRH